MAVGYVGGYSFAQSSQRIAKLLTHATLHVYAISQVIYSDEVACAPYACGSTTLKTAVTLPIEDRFVCGGSRNKQNWLVLLRVFPFAEGAPFANFFFLLRTDRVNRHPQTLAYGCTVLHPLLLRLVLLSKKSFYLLRTRLVTVSGWPSCSGKLPT